MNNLTIEFGNNRSIYANYPDNEYFGNILATASDLESARGKAAKLIKGSEGVYNRLTICERTGLQSDGTNKLIRVLETVR